MESEWLTVPPVQTNINFALVNHDAPEFVDSHIFNDMLTVSFSKYMSDATITTESVQLWQDGKQLACTIQPVKEDGNSTNYSNAYQISVTEPHNWNKITIKVTDAAKSYADVDATIGTYTTELDIFRSTNAIKSACMTIG